MYIIVRRAETPLSVLMTPLKNRVVDMSGIGRSDWRPSLACSLCPVKLQVATGATSHRGESRETFPLDSLGAECRAQGNREFHRGLAERLSETIAKE